MSIDMVIDPDKLQFNSVDRSDEREPRYIGLLFVLSFLGLIIWGAVTLSNSDTLPIKQVRIEGDFTNLSPVDLQLLVTDKVRGGFFNLDVDAVRLALLEEPWVSEVTVERIWPDALRVIVTEQVPYVRWKDSGLLNAEAKYFAPEASTIPQHLPLLSGPEDSEQLLVERFNLINERVQVLGFRVASVTLNERRAWSFQLENGIKVVLGRRDFEERLNRFLTLIPTTISGRVAQTDSIDMRYTNGFSIRWKK